MTEEIYYRLRQMSDSLMRTIQNDLYKEIMESEVKVMKNWTDYLQEIHYDVYERLCNCRNIKDDIEILVRWKWAWIQTYQPQLKYTKEDVLIQILELLDANGQSYLCDLTQEEYNELKQ